MNDRKYAAPIDMLHAHVMWRIDNDQIIARRTQNDRVQVVYGTRHRSKIVPVDIKKSIKRA
jgi:hypothetical protein